MLCDWLESNRDVFCTLRVDWVLMWTRNWDSEPWRFGGEPGRIVDRDGKVHSVASCGIHSGPDIISLFSSQIRIKHKSTRVEAALETELNTYLQTKNREGDIWFILLFSYKRALFLFIFSCTAKDYYCVTTINCQRQLSYSLIWLI